jgi:hypothetical protein
MLRLFTLPNGSGSTLSPFFTTGPSHGDVNHYRFHHEVFLPFTLRDRKRVYNDGSAQVYRVDIHPKHHDFHETKVSSSPCNHAPNKKLMKSDPQRKFCVETPTVFE